MKSLLRRLPYTITSTSNIRYLDRVLAMPDSDFDPVKLAMCLLHSEARTVRSLPVIVQIGACDGKRNDPLNSFIVSGRYKTIMLEPIPETFANLKRNYEGVPNLHFCCAALADQDGETDIFAPKGEIENCQVASFRREHVVKHLKDVNAINQNIISFKVKTLSPKSLMLLHSILEIDLLQIDAEGFDGEVIKLFLRETTPRFINFETRHLSNTDLQEIFRLAENHGYGWIHSRVDSLMIRLDSLTSSSAVNEYVGE